MFTPPMVRPQGAQTLGPRAGAKPLHVPEETEREQSETITPAVADQADSKTPD